MKMKHILTLLFAVIIFTGCTRPEFEIVAELSQNVSRSYSMTYYASDKKKGWVTETVLNVQDGKGMAKCVTRNPTVVWIAASGPTGLMPIWAERGDKITVKGESSDPLDWTIGGNEVNEEWSKWRKDNHDVLRSYDAKKVNEAVARYVKSNADSKLAALLLLTTYKRKDNEKEFAELWNSVPSKIKTPELLAAVGRADLLTSAQIDPPVRVGQFKLHCMGDTILTVNTSAADVSLLFFWTGDEPERTPALDSLRAISREDHQGRLLEVTDVAMTQDSMSWLNKARMDSVESLKWRRGWAPGGRMYSGISAFAVNGSPWFVVIDRKGNQAYNGPKVADALRVAREQLRKAPQRKEKAPAGTAKNEKK